MTIIRYKVIIVRYFLIIMTLLYVTTFFQVAEISFHSARAHLFIINFVGQMKS